MKFTIMEKLQDIIVKITAAKTWSVIRKYSIPTAFAAVFYVISFLLGNRTICVFKSTYGIPCPGCGMTRSYIHLFHGDIGGAFYYHPLFIIPIIVAALLIFGDASIKSKIYKSKIFWFLLLFLIVGVWIVRMIFMFPNTPPLDFNKFGLLPVIYRFLSHCISN